MNLQAQSPSLADHEKQFQRRSEVLSSKISSDIVLFDDEASCYFSMNEVGSRIWEALATPKTVSALSEELCLIFDVSREQAQKELCHFLDQLLSKNLISAS